MRAEIRNERTAAGNGRGVSRTFDPVLARLLERATFGHEAVAWNEARDAGLEAWVDRQLRPGSIDDADSTARLASVPSIGWTAARILQQFDGPLRDLRSATLIRAIFSKRQLFERVVELWNDHFCIDAEKGDCRVLATPYDREVIRGHALGRFSELVTAVAQSGAMLESLDNRSSRKEAPNENFARELLELHTLGVGQFTETDVREAARCFTGWSVRGQKEEAYGEFVFRAEWHDDGPKTVLGSEIPAGGGVADGVRVIALAVAHPACARRIAGKLCRHLVGEDPDEALVTRIAQAFTESAGDIRTVLRAVLVRATYAQTPPATLFKYKRPFHLAVGLLRATGARVEDTRGLLDELTDLGHLPFGWATPDGCPDVREAWEPALLARWRFVERFFSNRIAGVRVDLDELVRGRSWKDLPARVDEMLTGGRTRSPELEIVSERVRGTHPIVAENGREACTLAACSPGYQELAS